MKNTRSIVDQINANRERRAPPSLDELNRTLQGLERQLQERTAARTDATKQQAAAPSPLRPVARPPEGKAVAGAQASRADTGRTVDFSAIAAELQELRTELKREMSTGVRRELENLGRDMARLREMIASDGYSTRIAEELSRVGETLQTLAQKTRSEDLHVLRGDLEELKRTLQTLAREETVNKLDDRWDRLDQRFDAIESRHADESDQPRSAMDAQLREMREAIAALADLSQLKHLEENVKVLAAAVEHMSRQLGQAAGLDTITLIQERLDEISRAIAAAGRAAAAQAADRGAIERMDARIAALSNHIAERGAEPDFDVALTRMDELGRRMDSLAARHETSDLRLDDLHQQMEAIARQLSKMPSAADALAARMAELGRRIDDIGASLRDSDDRTGNIAQQVNAIADHLHSAPAPLAAGELDRLDDRITEIVYRLDLAAKMQKAADPARLVDAVDRRFDELTQRLDQHIAAQPDRAYMEGLGTRLDALAYRLAESAAPRPAFDEHVVHNLETQIADLSDHLSRSTALTPIFDDIRPRLVSIEEKLSGNHDTVFEAARKAAEHAVVHVMREGNGASGSIVADLAGDLKSLETLARQADARNAKTFEAIHDTLLKIVERLGSLEHETVASETAAPMFVDAPSLQFDTDAVPRRAGPAEAPAAKAESALAAGLPASEPSRPDATEARSSLLRGLSQAVKTRGKDRLAAQDAAEPAFEAPAAGEAAEFDPAIANRPLEPGSGVPDLNSIMRRVREERRAKDDTGRDEPSKADFIAAARRAAQAAAAESDLLKDQPIQRGGRSRRAAGDLIRRQRKPIMMAVAAVIVAMAALQIKNAFFSAHGAAMTSHVARQSEPVAPAFKPAEKPVRQTQAAVPPQQAAPSATVTTEDGSGSAESNAPQPSGSPAPAAQPMAAATATAPQTPQAATTPNAAAPATAAASAAPAAVPAPAQSATASPAPQVLSSQQAPAATSTSMQPGTAPIAVPAEVHPAALREAAAAGNPSALFEIANRYADGRGVQNDLAKAADWYSKAAERNFAPAEYRLGNFYEKGIGVTRDIGAAKGWYSKAAALGNASAMHNLAVLLAMGADGPVDNAGAVHWFTQAAELGIRDSQYNLGIMAAKGLGMAQDLQESYEWFALAAKGGDEEAAKKRDEVAKALKPDQLQHARGEVELWKAKPVIASANSADAPDAWRDTGATETAGIDMKKAIANIQKILIKDGFDPGSPDGVMGQKTHDAIAAFQKAHGMKPTGEVDQTLVKALLESNK